MGAYLFTVIVVGLIGFGDNLEGYTSHEEYASRVDMIRVKKVVHTSPDAFYSQCGGLQACAHSYDGGCLKTASREGHCVVHLPERYGEQMWMHEISELGGRKDTPQHIYSS